MEHDHALLEPACNLLPPRPAWLPPRQHPFDGHAHL